MTQVPADLKRSVDKRRHLIWLDGLAGVTVGVAMFALAGWLSDWYQLPKGLRYAMGTANLVYGTYSISLASRPRRPKALISLLVIGNLVWAAVCFALAFIHSDTASVFGLVHLVAEGLFVAGLACVEWRWRELLLIAR